MDIEQQKLRERLSFRKGSIGKKDAKASVEIVNNESTIFDLVDLIVKCSKEATKKEEESKFTDSLVELVKKLKELFKSEYCAFGTIDDKYVIDRACTLTGLPKDVKRAPITSESHLVCQSLRNLEKGPVFFYEGSKLKESCNYSKYRNRIIPENTTIVIIQDYDGDPQGYIQFLNSERRMEEIDFNKYKADLLRLAFVVKQWYALEQERLFLKDFKFINSISEDTNTVDTLLSKIMEYLSAEFNAGIISYRIPLLVGTCMQPVFFLRDCYVSNKIPNCEDVKKCYFRERMVKTKDKMGGVNTLFCKNYDDHIIPAEPIDSASELGVSPDIVFTKEAVIIPIIHNHSEKCNCKKNNRGVIDEECQICTERFKMYFGIFKLRILKSKDDGENDSIPDEVKNRLHNLAIHISVLLNAIVDKAENDSLTVFQTGLNDFSFTDFDKTKDFDKQCAKIIKKSTGAKVCAIYKYDKLSDDVVLSESTQRSIQMYSEESRDELFFEPDFDQTIENCRKWFLLGDQVTNILFENDEPVYYVTKDNTPTNSMILVPMVKKDGTRLGMILLLGKGTKKWDVSKTYWEQDKKYIKFMVDILSRIEESDADRLVFLLRLSHELRKPITEMVYKNDLLLSTAERNPRTISRGELIQGLNYNINSCSMFQQIIGDIETSYYVRKGNISYRFEDVNVKACILDVIRLFEQGGWASERRITFETQLSQMPQTMRVDKERIKQVFVNILKNAIQYSYDKSTIIVSYRFNERRGYHEIDFENYGIGIAEEEREIIFNLWKRGESAKKRRPNGTGMGLSIVKEIMTAHRGECYVKHLNNPTIFTVCIPKDRSKKRNK